MFTGQHPKLDLCDYYLDPCSAVQLDCAGKEDPHAHVETVTKALLPILAATAPRLVVVQGDTSSAIGGALAAGVAGIPIAHVEAGLRSHDRRHPWPEEEFRMAIDADAELLFAPTELSAANLRRERARGRIHVTGNSGIDAVLAIRESVARPAPGSKPRLLVTCHRRENWAEGISGVARALRMIASEGLARIEIILHPNPVLARRVRELLLGEPQIAFRPPCGHAETIAAMLRSALVLSDSGGMQEEAAALGVPLLVLRERTERPEAVASGSLELVGTDSDRIVAAVRRWLRGGPKPAPALPFGDGRAGQRIAGIIEEWLWEAGALSPPATSARMSPGHPVRW